MIGCPLIDNWQLALYNCWGSTKCCQFCKRALEVCMFFSAVLQKSIVVQVFTRIPPLVFIQYLLKRQTSVGPKQTLVFDSSMMTRTLSSTSTLAVHYLLVFWEQRNTLSQFACFSKINLAFLHFSHCWRKSMKGPLLPTSDSVAGDLVVASCSSFPSLPEPGLALFPSEKFFASDGLVPPLSTHRKLHTKHGWSSRVVLVSLILLAVLSVLLLLLVLLPGRKLLKSLSLVPTTSSPSSTASFSSPETMVQWNRYNIQFELNSFELCHPGWAKFN